MTEARSHNPSFTVEFCQHLERAITQEFSNHLEYKRVWCDGVLHAPYVNDQVNKTNLSFEQVNKTRSLETTVWLGEDGQTQYHATLCFGQTSLNQYSMGGNLLSCIPDQGLIDWDNFDVDQKKIKLILL